MRKVIPYEYVEYELWSLLADINRGVLKTFIAGNGAMWKKMTTFAAKFQSNKY
jgi:hypothetical protein